MKAFSRFVPAGLLGAILSCTAPAWADPSNLMLLPVVTHREGQPGLVAIDPKTEPTLERQARELSEVLSDAAHDLGYTVRTGDSAAALATDADDDALLALADQNWVLSPRLEQDGGKLRVRLVAVAPHSHVILTRSERLDASLLEVRTVVMLRELMERGETQEPGPGQPPAQPETTEPDAPRSAGRAVLALNATVFGGYVGFSLQKASGSEDERLIYPLAALGSGIGLGASLLVAAEWDVGVGDAWYIAAGEWWPAAGGLLLARSYDVTPEDRYVYGIVGASAGMASATAALTLGKMSDGGATIAHSGGAFGLGLGGLTELAIEGETEETPIRGMGYGAISGVLVGGALATQVDVETSRVLLIDLGASLGALGGAALASPLLIVEEQADPTRTRLWLSAVAAGTLLGGTATYFLTSNERPTGHTSVGAASAGLPVELAPYFTAVPEGNRGTRTEIGVSGRF